MKGQHRPQLGSPAPGIFPGAEHAVQGHAYPGVIPAQEGVIEKPVAAQEVDFRGTDPPLMQLPDHQFKGPCLGCSEGTVLGLVVGTQVGEHPLHLEVLHGEYGPDAFQIFPPLPQPVHAGVNGHMNANGSAQTAQLPGIVPVYHSLNQVVSPDQGELLHRGEAQNQNVSRDVMPPQLRSLLRRGHAKGPDAQAAQGLGYGHSAVAVGVGLDHRHEAAAWGQQSL